MGGDVAADDHGVELHGDAAGHGEHAADPVGHLHLLTYPQLGRGDGGDVMVVVRVGGGDGEGWW